MLQVKESRPHARPSNNLSHLTRATLFLCRAWPSHAAPTLNPVSALPRMLSAVFLPILLTLVAAAREAWGLLERS